jgi:site-specific DNA-methyltransferase (adenine-specific)
LTDLYKGDCLEVMKGIKSGSIDAIITDPPYGTTACKWDSVIDFKLMWEQLNRIIKPNGAIVLFGSEPFSSALRMSNIKNYKYDWYWNKKFGGNFVQAKRMPLKSIECVSIFSNGGKMPNYIPQMILRDKVIKQGGVKTSEAIPIKNNNKTHTKKTYTHKYPLTLMDYPKELGRTVHPTQKPVELLEYLIKTYTNEEETVLDFTMGSGSTGVAAKNLNRNFIGIEQDENYFNIAKERIEKENFKLF